jgi:hypothetical protein
VKVAVAVGAARVPRWQRDAIAGLRALPGIELAIVDVPVDDRVAADGFAARIAGPAMSAAPLAARATSLDGHDVVLNLTGRALDADAPHGTWSFQLGASDDTVLPFAHEVAHGARTVQIALIRRRGAQADVLRTGRFPAPMWYPTLLRLALAEAGTWPATFVSALRDGAELRGDGALPPRHGRRPSRARLLLTLGVRLVLGMRDAFFMVDTWNVGFAAGGPRALLDGTVLDVQWLPDPPQRTFLADPFVIERDGRRVMFVEDFSYDRDRGVIDALELDADNRVISRTRALDVPTHLSYPFPLEIDGELYLVPENCAAHEVALYRCVAFPDRWEREAALFTAFDGVDTTFFAHDGRWWAFCTRQSTGPSVALHAYHAPGPRGPWEAHPLNPIVIDVASARPAGPPFVVDGVLYRPGQDCSQTYGGAIAIARIDELTPRTYQETVVRRLAPPPGRFADGFHTVSCAGDVLVVDGKRTHYDARNTGRALRALRARITRALQRSRSHRVPRA